MAQLLAYMAETWTASNAVAQSLTDAQIGGLVKTPGRASPASRFSDSSTTSTAPPRPFLRVRAHVRDRARDAVGLRPQRAGVPEAGREGVVVRPGTEKPPEGGACPGARCLGIGTARASRYLPEHLLPRLPAHRDPSVRRRASTPERAALPKRDQHGPREIAYPLTAVASESSLAAARSRNLAHSCSLSGAAWNDSAQRGRNSPGSGSPTAPNVAWIARERHAIELPKSRPGPRRRPSSGCSAARARSSPRETSPR